MRLTFKILGFIFAAITIFLVHYIIVSLLPYPFNLLNFIYILLILKALHHNSISTIWLALLLSFFLELFSSLPFGVTMMTVVGSLAILSWLLKVLITNNSWYVSFFSGLVGFSIFKLMSVVIFLMINFLSRDLVFIMDSRVFVNYGIEILFNASILVFLYLLLRIFKRQSNVNYLPHILTEFI